MNYIDVKRTKNRYYCRTAMMGKWKRIKHDTYHDYMQGYFGLTRLGKQRIITVFVDTNSETYRIERI